MLKHIPNFITCCNLLCGCIGVVAVTNGHLEVATYLIWLAAILDFFDGFTARILKAYSAIGKELDSLADMVTFGFLPAYMMFSMITTASNNFYLPYMAFLIAIFSALRLAKFNVDTRQAESFIGLPTPANALFISALPLLAFESAEISDFVLSNVFVLIGITIVFSLLMVAELPLFSLKFKNYKWVDNKVKFLFLIVSVVLLISLKFISIPLIIILYITLSIIVTFNKVQ